ncbi:triose-phosphate isomerase family protein [Virgisporangium aurantiacum]|uniref:Triosephosphate isomerase n=1 Tax=Virgisporangium aurantiacum TaxID=175570 RepID=A0A8J3Z422_9ACTN|nr:triose-phosphate isomerase family protein [Virgisporangium aurantiacum]GIJ54876.1 triosephosphate isomerase [Virgisporangium aurantiacum]
MNGPVIGVSLKMYFGYGQTLSWCRSIVDRVGDHPALRTVRLFVLPSFPAIVAAAEIFAGTPIAVGAQNLSTADGGAHTGEVSGAMLRESGARYVAVGHAERRAMYGEDEATVAGKTAAALRNGLVPVLCVGEPRPAPALDAASECTRQLASALRTAPDGPVTVAYEPVWAIGADKPADVPYIAAVCAELRDRRPDLSVIYGGSAGPGLLTRLGPAVDGLFLGRFAHDPAALADVLDEAGTMGSPA